MISLEGLGLKLFKYKSTKSTKYTESTESTEEMNISNSEISSFINNIKKSLIEAPLSSLGSNIFNVIHH